jgi:hypothetical protein
VEYVDTDGQTLWRPSEAISVTSSCVGHVTTCMCMRVPFNIKTSELETMRPYAYTREVKSDDSTMPRTYHGADRVAEAHSRHAQPYGRRVKGHRCRWSRHCSCCCAASSRPCSLLLLLLLLLRVLPHEAAPHP